MSDTKINELFGAKVFQKIVFKVEDIKFKILDTFFPNYENYYEKNLKKVLNKKLSLAKTEEQKELLIRDYQEKILLSRKEINNKKNRNYHIRYDNPNDFIVYLNKNKKIHTDGLIRNGIIFLLDIPLIVLCDGVFDIIGYCLLSLNTIFTVINFECVNLQNYNIKRLTSRKELFEKLSERRMEKDIKRYGKISSLVCSELKKDPDIPPIENIVDNIQTREQLYELRSLLLNQLNKNEKGNENDINKRRVLKWEQ